MKQIKKKGKAKGSVLLTVVGVMMVMVVFLMSTLALTSSANRRSYYSYYETQAQFAAQAALDAVTNTAYTDEKFHAWVQDKVKEDAGQLPINVQFDGSNIQFTNNADTVRCTIEKVSEPNYIWDDATQAVHKQEAWKITATAYVGRGRNSAEYSVSNYIYENFHIDNEDLLAKIQNMTEYTIYKYKPGKKGEEGKSGNPVGTEGVLNFGALGTSNNFVGLGPQMSSLSRLPDGRIAYDLGTTVDVSNRNCAVGNVLYVFNLNAKVTQNIEFQRFGEHAIYYGNVKAENKGDDENGAFKGYAAYANISSDLTPDGQVAYKDIPYVYIDGRIITEGGAFVVGMKNIDNNAEDNSSVRGNYPVNLYCGGVYSPGMESSVGVYGDAYLYDPYIDSVWCNQICTALSQFVRNNINKVDSKYLSNVSGNLICNNNSLSLSNSDGSKIYINGDLIFTNPQGTLNINGPVTVGGKVVCAGKLNGQDKLTCSNVITGDAISAYYDEEYANHTAYTNRKGANAGDVNLPPEPTHDPFPAKIVSMYFEGEPEYEENREGWTYDVLNAPNGGCCVVVQPSGSRLPEGWEGFNWGGSQAWFANGTKFMYQIDDAAYNTAYNEWMERFNAWQVECQTLKDASTPYHQRLMPFSMRLDEIHKQYTRWDLKSTDESAVSDIINGSESTDPWIRESQDCGHTWRVGTFKDYSDGNTYYAPCTSPIKNDGADAFIPIYTAQSADGYVNEKADAGVLYTDIDAFRTAMGDKKDNALISSSSSAVSVPMVYEGAEHEKIDAIVINQSGVLDLSQVAGKTVLLDPTGFSASKPMFVIFENVAANAPATIIINNTAKYKTDYKSVDKVLTDAVDRGCLRIFWKAGSGASASCNFYMYNSGLYGMMNNYTGTRDFTIVQNPLYPGQDGYGDLTDIRKYAYQFIPISVSCTQENNTVNFGQASIVNTDVLFPLSGFSVPNMMQDTLMSNVHYYEECNSNQYISGAYPLALIGSVVSSNLSAGSNVAMCAYIGDSHNPGGEDKPGEPEQDDEVNSAHSSKLGQEYNDYFNNDHLGAS